MTRALFLAFLLAASSAAAQQTPPSAKTTAQQARSYILSAFMTGSAPMIVSDDVQVAPELRQQLGLPPDAGGRAVYEDLLRIVGGRPVHVRPAIRDEIAKVQAHPDEGKPVFAIEAGDEVLVVQYDLDRDMISFVGSPGAVAAAEKASAAAAMQPPPAPAAPAPAPAAAPASTAPITEKPLADAPPAPAPEVPRQVVEPQVPKPAPAAVPSQKPAPALRRNGPCVVKPVMSDQDLVNCGATPQH